MFKNKTRPVQTILLLGLGKGILFGIVAYLVTSLVFPDSPERARIIGAVCVVVLFFGFVINQAILLYLAVRRARSPARASDETPNRPTS
jgi:cation transporter-like permease